MNKYHFEITDTFGGEANYCWVRHYIVHARTMLAAIHKVMVEEGYTRLDRVFQSGDEVHWKVRNACIKIFGSEMDDQAHATMRGNAKELK